MTRDEAKKLASEWAIANDWEGDNNNDVIRAYMACFDALTKGDPDKWVLKDKETGRLSMFFGFDKTSPDFVELMQVSNPLYNVVPVKILEVTEGSSNG